MKTFMKQSKKGFTLIEMIVVIVIVAILATISVPAVMKYIDDAQDAKMIAKTHPLFIEAQVVTLELYGKYGEKGNVGPDGGSWEGSITPVLIEKELLERFKMYEVSKSYDLGILPNMSIFYDGLAVPFKFDSSVSTHRISKMGLQLIDKSNPMNIIYIVFKENDSARVFRNSSKSDLQEIFCKIEEDNWCMNFS